MKKIRESFHMIAAAVFCLVMSVKATVLKEMGQAAGLSTGNPEGVSVVQNAAENTANSSMYRTALKHDKHIKKVFFWLGGPGDRIMYASERIPPSIQTTVLRL